MSLDANTSPHRIFRPGELAAALGVSRPTLWRMEQRGEIPPQTRFTRGISGWRAATIERWFAEKERESAYREADKRYERAAGLNGSAA